MALGHILSQSISRNEEFRSPMARASASHLGASQLSASQPQVTLSSNLNRLLSAAVVSPRFQHLLLTDPVAALAAGYNGETFQLTQVEYAAVTSLSVSTLRDFAAQLLHSLQEAVPFGTESQSDFQFAEATNASRDPMREQPTTLPHTGQSRKQEAENSYNRFAAPSRHARFGMPVNEGYRTNHAATRYGS